MAKTIVFRADGNFSSGLGHVYRLLGLVDMFQSKYQIKFVTHTSTPTSVFSKDLEVVRIPDQIDLSTEPNWLLANFLPTETIIICDGYQFTSDYQKKVKENEFPLVYIDDLVSQYMYADVVVNHSPGIDANHYKAEDYTRLALGTKYALLRSEFLDQITNKKPTPNARNVFVCFGGSDPHGFNHKVTKALLRLEEIDHIFAVVGASNQDQPLSSLEVMYPDKVSVLRNLPADQLLSVMLKSQFAVVPSSTILYELCCSNTPCLSGYYVDNQKRIHDGFLSANAITSMGDIKDYEENDFVHEIANFLKINDHSEQLRNQRVLFDENIRSRYLELINHLWKQ